MAHSTSVKPGQKTRITARVVQREFRRLADSGIAAHSARFFKTGKGEYGEGDRFLGIRVPDTRLAARRYRMAPLRTVNALLKSRYHEERLMALLILVDQYARGDAIERRIVFDNYLAHRRYINNWDLVDSSAHKIVGAELQDAPRELLYKLAASEVLWDRRIAVIATFHFIGNDDFADALRLAELLLEDEHDLIHKAVGWMLREIGNRDGAVERSFLEMHYRQMPRTMLRYAIEKFPEPERRAWLNGTV